MMGGPGGVMGGPGEMPGMMGMTGMGFGSHIGLSLIIVLVLAAIWLFQQVTRGPQTGG
jgi:hypothetical protein